MWPSNEGGTNLHLPTDLSAAWTLGHREFSVGMVSQQSAHLYLIIWQHEELGELQLQDLFMVPNITFLFILELFVQSNPLMLTSCTLITQAEEVGRGERLVWDFLQKGVGS